MAFAQVLQMVAVLLSRIAWAAVLLACVWSIVSDDGDLGARLQEFLRDAWASISFALYDNPHTHRLYMLVAGWFS